MRILSSAVILAVTVGFVGCADKTQTASTPPTQAPAPAPAPAPAAPAGRAAGAAPAPAPAPAGRAAGAAAPAGAQLTVAQHSATMKQIAQSNAALGKAAKSGDLMAAAAEAKNLATLFATVEQFYTQRAKPDAIKLAQTGRTGAMAAAQAAAAGDQMKTVMEAGNVGGTCKQCHGMYREGDAQTGFRFNAASGIQ